MTLHRIAVGAVLLTSATFAQTQPATTRATTQPATTQATTRSAEDVTTERLAKFTQLKFDRRLPTALLAMAATQPTDEGDRFVADVAAGRWEPVSKLIASFDEKSAQTLHRHLLQSLAQGAQPDSGPQVSGSFRVMNRGGGQDPNANAAVLMPDDVLALSDAATTAPEEQDVNLVGQLLGKSFGRGAVTDGVVARLERGTRHFGGPAADEPKRTRAAELLFAAGKLVEAGQFLPPLDAALATKDVKTLDLHARHLAALGAQPNQTAALRKSWDVTQSILAVDAATPAQRDAAVNRALDLMPKLTKQLGVDWLKSSFAEPTKGRTVIAGIGSDAAGHFMSFDENERKKALSHQRQAVDQLAAVAGPELKHWSPALNLMAVAWLQEADYTKPRPSMKQMNQGPRYDRYGNYMGGQMQRNNNEPPPIDAEELLKVAPTDAWVAVIDPSLAPRVRAAIVEMHLKHEDPDAALPLVEQLAKEQQKVGLALSNELLTVWAKVRNPNADGNQGFSSGGYYGPYGYQPYGQQSGGLPLTRTAQVRNLAELKTLLGRLGAVLPAGETLSESNVVTAFTTAHSAAEVYRPEDIESVFGPVEKIPVKTLAGLLESMRERLARQWRQAAVQQQAKTKRTDKDVDAEMSRGYELLVSMIEARLKTEPDWKLHATLGAALFDWAEFDYGKQVELAVYTARRDRAFESFAKAADLYVAALPKLEEKDESAAVFQQWFNAALGASDLAQLTRQQAPSATQLERIKQALMNLQPPDLRERHVTKFGEGLSQSTSSLQPELKPRYLRAGIAIVGDHPSAAEARKLVKYYDDLLTEVALYAQVDGDAAVGHGKPFGLHVGVRHTDAVGREAGGFGKYLQNQQSNRSYMYYGGSYGGSGGPKNYRDDFEKKIREALVEGFDIVSVTYHDEKNLEPRGYGRPGWRETPLAYVLLKAKDASVDKVPPIQMDMDFSDRQGQVVLPVTSQVLLIDARPAGVPPRPVTKLAIVQTLDERDAETGKLTLDVKATSHGLLPDLSDLVDTNIAGFTVEKIADQGLSVTKMDAAGDVVAPVCERSWIVNLVAEPGAKGAAAMTFRFPAPKVRGAEATYKRYADADVVDVSPEIAVAGVSLAKRRWWPIVAGGVAVVAGMSLLFVWWKRRRPAAQEVAQAYAMPRTLNAFSVLELLRAMQRDDRFAPDRAELAAAIDGIERTHFAPVSGNGNGSPDLAQVAQQWVARAR